MSKVVIEQMTDKIWLDVARIYKSGIATKNATFQTEVPDWKYWDNSHRKDCRLIAKIENVIIGWVALSKVSSRPVYSGVAEVSIYIDSDYRGKGIGGKLMEALIEGSESSGVWTLQAGVFPENISSIKLHHKYGFRTIGINERIGKMDGIWRDVVLLERRSSVIGIN